MPGSGPRTELAPVDGRGAREGDTAVLDLVAESGETQRDYVVELGTVESAPKQDGRNMVMVLAPTKKKSEAKAQQRRKRDEAKAAARQEPSEDVTTEDVADEGVQA